MLAYLISQFALRCSKHLKRLRIAYNDACKVHIEYKGRRFMNRMEGRSGRTYYFYINKFASYESRVRSYDLDI